VASAAVGRSGSPFDESVVGLRECSRHLRVARPILPTTPLVDREGHMFEMSHSGHPCATHQPTRTNLEIIENNGTVTEIEERSRVGDFLR